MVRAHLDAGRQLRPTRSFGVSILGRGDQGSFPRNPSSQPFARHHLTTPNVSLPWTTVCPPCPAGRRQAAAPGAPGNPDLFRALKVFRPTCAIQRGVNRYGKHHKSSTGGTAGESPIADLRAGDGALMVLDRS